MKDDTASDLAAFGVLIDAESKENDHFDVWEENAPALRLFMKMQTQWNVLDGCFIGLNYQSLQFLFTIDKVEDPAEMLDDLQAMEIAALQVLNKRKD